MHAVPPCSCICTQRLSLCCCKECCLDLRTSCILGSIGVIACIDCQAFRQPSSPPQSHRPSRHRVHWLPFFPGLDPREPCLRVALPRVMILDKSLVMPYHPECIKITSIQIVINKHCCIHHHLNNTLIGCAFAARFVYIRSPHYTYATDPKWQERSSSVNSDHAV